MGLYLRKKVGPFNLSASRRGPSASVGSGCTVTVFAGCLALDAVDRFFIKRGNAGSRGQADVIADAYAPFAQPWVCRRRTSRRVPGAKRS